MSFFSIPKSLPTYRGNGPALARIENDKLKALYYAGTTLVSKQYILRSIRRKRWGKAAELKLLEITRKIHKYRPTGDIIVIEGSRKELVSGSVEDFGYQTDHEKAVAIWEYPPTSS